MSDYILRERGDLMNLLSAEDSDCINLFSEPMLDFEEVELRVGELEKEWQEEERGDDIDR